MKRTTLVLGGLLTLSLVANGFADTTNVYSKNAVGYISVGLNTSFTLMSVQLGKSTSSALTIGDILPTASEGTILYIYDTPTLNYFSFMYSGGLWYDMQTWGDGSTQKLERGVGFWVGWTGSPTNLSVVGEVPGSAAATTTVALANGYVLMSYPYPTEKVLSATKLGQDSQNGDEIFVWTGATYKIYGRFGGVWYDFDTWAIVDPVLSPGQGFWYHTATQRNVNETKPYTWP